MAFFVDITERFESSGLNNKAVKEDAACSDFNPKFNSEGGDPLNDQLVGLDKLLNGFYDVEGGFS